MNTQRVAVIVTATAALALLAACGGSPSAAGSGSPAAAVGTASSGSAVAWVACVRSHGVPAFPGLDSTGDIPKITSGQQVGVSDARLTAARNACQSLWPYQSAPPSGQSQQLLTDDLNFARCMRAHGLPNFPDPTNSDGHLRFVLSPGDGIDPHSPQVLAKARACLHLLPVGSGLPSVQEGTS